MSITNQLKKNLDKINERIGRAAEKSQRDPAEVQLVAVTKYVDAEFVRALCELGCRHFGESRPQVLWKKAEALADLPIEWHMIGHLQSNKIRRTLPTVSLIHSGDSLSHLQAMDSEAKSQNRTTKVLLEVNVSGDETKHGFSSTSLKESLAEIAEFQHLSVHGLMAMASRIGGESAARDDFRAMSKLREEVISENRFDNLHFQELSMGMSGDFEVAIEYGATLIRVGSSLFDGIDLA